MVRRFFPGYRAWGALSVLAAFAMACWFYVDAHNHRLCCDALDYWRMAAAYEADGWFANHPWAGLRTWLYPTVLALVSRSASAIAVEPAKILFVLQFAAYAASNALLARTLFPQRPSLAVVLFTLLSCNPFVSPYLAVALTDAPALTCFNVWLAAIVADHARKQTGGSLRWFVLAAVMAGAATALRPAYLWLPALTLALPLWPAFGEIRPGKVMLALFLPLLLLSPQIAINKHLFDRMTPFPTADLAGSQVRWGIENLKYATAPKPGSDARMFYSNPFVGDTLDKNVGIDWYFRHPLRGAATLGAKLVGAFDFDFLPAYVWDRTPTLKWLFRGISLGLLVLGLQGLWRYVRHGGTLTLPLGPRALPPLVFAGWAAVTLASVIELRFTLPMLSLLLPLALWFAAGLQGQPRTALRRAFAVFVAGMLVASAIAGFVAAQNVLL